VRDHVCETIPALAQLMEAGASSSG
jgi:hypothetical protein